MPNYFFLSDTGEKIPVKIGNGRTKNLMGWVLGAAVFGSFMLLGFSALVAQNSVDVTFKQEIYDGIHVIAVMTIGAFLALVKDIFNPRREIEVNDIIDLLDKISNAKQSNNNVEKLPQKRGRFQ